MEIYCKYTLVDGRQVGYGCERERGGKVHLRWCPSCVRSASSRAAVTPSFSTFYTVTVNMIVLSTAGLCVCPLRTSAARVSDPRHPAASRHQLFRVNVVILQQADAAGSNGSGLVTDSSTTVAPTPPPFFVMRRYSQFSLLFNQVGGAAAVSCCAVKTSAAPLQLTAHSYWCIKNATGLVYRCCPQG